MSTGRASCSDPVPKVQSSPFATQAGIIHDD
jgi:hypothetical protein